VGYLVRGQYDQHIPRQRRATEISTTASSHPTPNGGPRMKLVNGMAAAILLALLRDLAPVPGPALRPDHGSRRRVRDLRPLA